MVYSRRQGSLNPFWQLGKLDVAAYLKTNGFATPTAATIMYMFDDINLTRIFSPTIHPTPSSQ